MTLLQIISALMPFSIEVIGDKILIGKGKKDIPLWVRTILVILFTSSFKFEGWNVSVHIDSDRLLLACAPFLLFDVVLNLVRGKDWDYVGQTKMYDAWVGRINPYAGLTFRILALIGIIILIAQ